MNCFALALLFGTIAIVCEGAAVNAAPANRLAKEKSPYLLQHAHNPVDWLPWGAEAFAKARAEEKPIFLSIGYSTCHWCHVMAHESFENEEVARILNEHFVSIKVDREERPDVDRVYMTFVQATTGGGGWPMSVWLTPDLKPFVGGTYFPPSDRYGRPGFPTVLKKIAEAWKNDRPRIVEQGEQIVNALREHAGAAKSDVPLDPKILESCYEQIARNFDAEQGGFGDAPKFPRPVTLNFLLRMHARDPESTDGKHALEMATTTLRKMAAGGMHDHLGGGFHRYSVDRFWHIPHFEKMLYDQAQLALAYLDAFQIARDPLFEKTARDILDYVRRDMTAPGGGFFSAEDADSLFEPGQPEHGEGVFYVWTKSEIDGALGAKTAEIFNRVYGVEAQGNAPAGSDPQGEFEGKNTLIRRYTDAETAKIFKTNPEETSRSLAESRRKLFDLRAKRPRPHLDDKIITAWNGLMISAFARAAQVLDERAYLETAERAAGFLKQNLVRDHRLVRSFREGASEVGGFADDYAFLIQGLLDLYESGFDAGWLQWAGELQQKQHELFADKEGGFFNTDAHAANILLRMKEDYDGAEPAPNSIAALNLLRLAQMLDDELAREEAMRTMRAFAGQLSRTPSALPQMLVAFEFSLTAPRQIVIAGNPDAADTSALLREIHAHFLPHKIVLLADGDAGQQWLSEKVEFIKRLAPVGGKATAFVCENYVCKLPVTDAESLRKALTEK
ncbi:MAG: hypothetical protein QOD99_1041 [Chthoniobacter sp.]|jgi:uncharacterized protein YyaL (SSP411 family)|nr:hypothetical protein [Chthoniobacter sp.]